jgi:hypothetical protein
MKRALPAFAAFALVVCVGFLHGMWINRWAPSSGLSSALRRLADVPKSVGDWDGQDVDPNQDPEEIAQLGVEGYVCREYTQRGTGRKVLLVLVCGRPGPICVHSPDICFRTRGNEMSEETRQYVKGADGRKRAEFLSADFRDKKRDRNTPTMRVFWSWGVAGAWQAPDNPRWTFGRYPALYRMYVIQAASAASDKGRDLDFIRAVLPGLHKSLFAAK